MKGILMPYYHNQRAYGARGSGCQNPRTNASGCRSAAPSACPSQPSCPSDVPARAQTRPSCPVKNSCGDDTNPCCSLAVAGVVNQKTGSPTYDVERALTAGTIYTELDKPFLGKGGCKR
ncbi:MAG: spore coat associated protein CotJA [Butyrivibrio sp.]|nr:spore coat associated protein CotJA [Butyrivibrio sp.]